MILGWFVSRWRVETTFQEVRTHLGVETQRQWSDLAILRTTPALLGLFSLITVWADGLGRDTTTALRPNAAAWYRKQEPTFSDAIAAVRRVLWCPPNFSMSRQIGDIIEIPTSLLNRVFETSDASQPELRKVELRRIIFAELISCRSPFAGLAAYGDRPGSTRRPQFRVLERQAFCPPSLAGEFIEERDIVGAFRATGAPFRRIL